MHALSLILLLSLAVAAVVSVKDLPFDVKLKVRNILKACDFIEARLTNVDNVVEIVAPGDKESVLLVFKLGRAATFMCGFWHTARRNGPPPNVSAALWHNLLTTAYMDCLSDEAGVKMVQKVLWGDSDGHSKALKIYDNLMLEETSVGKYTSPVALMRILNLGSHVKQSRLRFMRSVRREDQKIQFRIAMKTFWRQPESPLETALREHLNSVMNSKEGRRRSSGLDGADDDAEDDEESSSSLLASANLFLGEPSKTRRLKSDAAEALEAVDEEEDDEGTNKVEDQQKEEKARDFFLQGVELEKDGKMYEAILKYKKAVRLVPDIERRAFDFTQNRTPSKKEKTPEISKARDSDNNPIDEAEDAELDMGDLDSSLDMVARLFRMSITSGILCQPALPAKNTHISCLPFEVLIAILKWVVSSDLDLKSLELCSEVCRGFYLAARSNDIWKPVCLRTWGLDKTPKDIQVIRKPGEMSSWRQFYLTRPRVQLHGCYIARMSYLRQGERGFQDHEFYRSWHVVQYYRLIRFFAGGRLAMVTTADEPSVAVKGLSNRFSSSLQGVMFGSYKTVDNRVICVVHKAADKVFNNANANRYRRRRGTANNYTFEVPEQHFHFELELNGRRFQRLHWKSYTVLSRYVSGAGPEHRSDFDVNNFNTFPVLHFSPVKSYITDAQRGLD